MDIGCQVFVDEVVDWLWQSTSHSDERVISAAFKALSYFPSSLFTVRHFPSDVVIGESKTDSETDVELSGHVYTKLLSSLPSSVLPGK